MLILYLVTALFGAALCGFGFWLFWKERSEWGNRTSLRVYGGSAFFGLLLFCWSLGELARGYLGLTPRCYGAAQCAVLLCAGFFLLNFGSGKKK